MNKLETALAELGLKQSFFDELKADIQSDKILSQTGLIQSTKEDVEDELVQLESPIDEDVRDEDDESEVDMNILSPTMKAIYK